MAKISKKANIHPSTVIGNDCIIEDFVSIEENCKIGDGVHIKAFSHIYYNSVIGDNCYIGVRCNIGSDGFGYAQNQKGESHFTPQIGNVVIEENVTILDHSSIDRGAFEPTLIKKNSLLGGHTHIAHNLEIGENAEIGHGFVVAGSTKIGKNVKLGGRVNCVGHLKITDNFTCDSMALINNSVSEEGHYAGSLLKKTEEWDNIKEALRELGRTNLEDILKND